jgi:uncharacterized membrane protein
MTQKELIVLFSIFVFCGCYFGYRTFMDLIRDGEVSRIDFSLALICYGFAIAVSARMGGYFAF